jgi:hypothetical protein
METRNDCGKSCRPSSGRERKVVDEISEIVYISVECGCHGFGFLTKSGVRTGNTDGQKPVRVELF